MIFHVILQYNYFFPTPNFIIMGILSNLVFCALLLVGCKTEPNHQPIGHSTTEIKETFNFDGNIIMSNNAGNTWESLDTLIPKDFDIMSSALNDHLLYLGGDSAEVIIIDMQNDRKYTRENIMATLLNKVPIAANRATNLSVSKSGVFAFVLGEGLFKKAFEKSNWMPFSTPEGTQNVHQLMEDEDGNTYIVCPYGVYKTPNQGATWERIFKYGFANNMVKIADNILVNGVLGLHKTEDHGKTWNKIAIKDWNTMNENDTEISLSTYKDTLLILRPMNREMWKPAINELVYSLDKGKTWQNHAANDFLKQQDKVNKVFYVNDRMICITDTKMMYSDDGGKSWVTSMMCPVSKDFTLFNVMSYGNSLVCIKQRGGC